MDAASLHIQPADPEPIYRQIAAQVRRMAMGGQLVAGEAMPSVRDVAACHAINPMTVSKAYSQLEAEGLLERQRGKGMVVAAGTPLRPGLAQRWALLEPALDALARQAKELELPPQDVAERLLAQLQQDDDA